MPLRTLTIIWILSPFNTAALFLKENESICHFEVSIIFKSESYFKYNVNFDKLFLKYGHKTVEAGIKINILISIDIF